MWNFTTLKIQRTFQDSSKILELQNSVPHINGVKCTWFVMKSYILLYKET
jgi:hypothetical protein